MSESIRVRGLRGVASVVCLLMLFVAAPVAAQSYRHSVLVDSDNDVGTGCTVNSAAGSVSGIEVRLSADVSGTPPQVNSVSRETCVGGTFGMPVVVGGGYPVALNGGIGGADAIELAMAYADIPQPPAQDWRVAFLSESDNGADLLGPLAVNGLGAAPAPPATPSPDLIPTLSPGGLIGLSVAMALLLLWGARRHRGLLSVLMLCGSLAFFGVAWAANFLADGNLGDWAGVSPNGSDGSGDSTSGEVAIDIIAGFAQREGGSLFFRVDVNDAETSNHAPIVADQAFSVDENSANATAVGTVVATDSDVGDTLSYAITAGNGAGTFAMDAGTGAISVADNTALDFEVSSSFVLTVSVTDDGTPVASSSATITINVNDLNEAPTAVADSYNATEDTALNVAAAGVLANDSDPDGNTLTSVLDTGPANAASFTLNADGSFSYTPTTGFNGADSFTYHATDGLLDSATVTVSITVNAINDPPVAVDDARMTTEDFVTNIADGDPNNLLSNDSDPDGDTLTVVAYDAVSTLGASVVVNANGGYTHDPTGSATLQALPAGSSVDDTFTYTIQDPSGASDTATVTMNVGGANDAPVAAGDAYNTTEDTALNVPASGVLTNDSDIDAGSVLTAVLDTGPTNAASFTLNADGSFDYTPAANFSGNDSFTYSANDGTVSSAAATVTISVGAQDDPPTAVADAASVAEDSGASAINVLANDTDPDGGPISISGVTQPGNGTVVIVGGGSGLTYQPDPNYCNTPPGSLLDTFTYTLAPGGSSTTVTMTVTCVDDPPTAVNDVATVTEDDPATAINVLGNDTDPDGGPLTIGSVTQPANGTVVITGGGTGLTYQPTANYCNDGVPTDTFTYTLNGGSSGTVAMTVTCVNDPPAVVAPGPFSVIGNVRIQVPDGGSDLLAGASDVEGDLLAIGGTVPTTTVQGGSLSINTAVGTFSYNPPAGFEGADSFSFDVCDDGVPSECATATVNLTVSGMVWFVDPAAAAGDGRLATPFNDIDALNAVNDGAAGHPEAGDDIFIYSGTHNGSLTLLASQRVFGQGADATLATMTGLAPSAFSDPFPVTNMLAPLWHALNATALTLSTNNTLRGFTLGNTGTGTDLSGSGFGSLTVSDVTVGGSGQALDLSNGILVDGAGASPGFNGITSSSGARNVSLVNVGGTPTFGSGTLQGASGQAFYVDGGTGTFSYAGSITGSAGQRPVDIVNKSGGSVSLSGAITSSGNGVALNNNTGASIAFSGTLTLSSGPLVGFYANGGGTVTATGTGSTVASVTGTAVNIVNTTIGAVGITFRSVSASGATNAIVLNNAGSGGFTVTGDGPNGTDGSGGTIQNITGRGVEVISTDNVTLRNMTVTNVATTDAANPVCDGLVNTGCNAGIHMSGATNVVLDNIGLNGSGEIGINGVTVSGLTLENSDIRNCGNQVNEGCLQVFGLSGTSAISNSTIALPSERAAYINNINSPNLILSVINSTFSDTQSSGIGADGLELNFMGSSTATVDVVDSAFRRNRTNGLQVLAQGTSTVGVDITGSTFDREAGIGIGIDLSASDSAGLDFNVIGNPLINSRNGSALNVFADGSAVIEGRINNNPSIQAGGAGTSGFGISVVTNENAQGTVQINNNVVSNIGADAAIRTQARLKAGGACGTVCSAGRLDATITNNTTTVDAGGLYDIWVQSNDDSTICANVANNTVSGATGVAFRERTNAANSTVLLQGFVTDAVATWNGSGNTPINLVSASNNGTLQGGTCTTPSNPLP